MGLGLKKPKKKKKFGPKASLRNVSWGEKMGPWFGGGNLGLLSPPPRMDEGRNWAEGPSLQHLNVKTRQRWASRIRCSNVERLFASERKASSLSTTRFHSNSFLLCALDFLPLYGYFFKSNFSNLI